MNISSFLTRSKSCAVVVASIALTPETLAALIRSIASATSSFVVSGFKGAWSICACTTSSNSSRAAALAVVAGAVWLISLIAFVLMASTCAFVVAASISLIAFVSILPILSFATSFSSCNDAFDF